MGCYEISLGDTIVILFISLAPFPPAFYMLCEGTLCCFVVNLFTRSAMLCAHYDFALYLP